MANDISPHPELILATTLELCRQLQRTVRDCLAHLFTALRRTSLYPADHPACRDSVAALAQELTEILSHDATLAAAVVDDQLLLSGYPQGENEMRFAGGMRDLHRSGHRPQHGRHRSRGVPLATSRFWAR